jgi:hypothetical protein
MQEPPSEKKGENGGGLILKARLDRGNAIVVSQPYARLAHITVVHAHAAQDSMYIEVGV